MKYKLWLTMLLLATGCLSCGLFSGYLVLTTNVEGGSLYLNGEYQEQKTSTTAVTIQLEPADYELIILKEGYVPFFQSITVGSFSDTAITVVLANATTLVTDNFDDLAQVTPNETADRQFYYNTGHNSVAEDTIGGESVIKLETNPADTNEDISTLFWTYATTQANHNIYAFTRVFWNFSAPHQNFSINFHINADPWSHYSLLWPHQENNGFIFRVHDEGAPLAEPILEIMPQTALTDSASFQVFKHAGRVLITLNNQEILVNHELTGDQELADSIDKVISIAITGAEGTYSEPLYIDYLNLYR